VGLFRRNKTAPVEARDITSVPWDVGGPLVTAVTQDRALTLAPVYAAVRFLADQISSLPLQPFRRAGSVRDKLDTLPQLFRMLDDDGVLNDWVFTAVSSLALRGNAVGLVTARDGMGFPTVVTWLSMDDIWVDDANYPRPVWYWKGHWVDSDDIVHIPWFKIAGRTLGLSPIEAYALTITAGLESQKFGTDWFQHGGFPPGTFRNSAKTVDATEADVIKNRLVAAIRSRKPLVYGNDWEWKAETIPPEQAQFIETFKLTANQIAAIYGIAPEEIGGEAANSMTYMNEEHRELRRMADCRPWLDKLERKFGSWLPERQFVRFNVDAPIRVDLKTRREVFKLEREMGFRNIDEQRALEDLPPLPNGEGEDYTPLSKPAASAAPANEPASAPAAMNGHSPTPVPAMKGSTT